eukprot:EG_transcript_11392
MDDDAVEPGPGGFEAGLPRSVVTSILPVDDATMEDVIDKLKMLDYEADFCMRHGQFRISRTTFSRPSITPGEQFFFFTTLVAWLLGLAGEAFQAPSQFDDPNASTSSILTALKGMGLNIKDVPPAKLRLGYGDAVLHVLNMLCDKVLVKRAIQFKTPEWAPDRYDDEMEITEGPEGDAPEDAGSDEGDDVLVEDLLMEEAAATKDIITPEANPQEWAEEAQRVAPLLKLTWKNEFRDWRSHLAWTQTLLKSIDKTFPSVKLALEATCESINKAIETIQKREQGLVEQCTAKIEEFKAYKKHYNAVADKYKASQEGLNTLSNELNQISEVLETMKAEIASREEAMADTSSLVKIKEAMGTIKAEISDMELKIGVYQHRMMHYLMKNPGKKHPEVRAEDVSDSEEEDWRS